MSNLDRQKSLRAAKGAMAGGRRQRAVSSPLSYPDSSNAAANALNAATVAHRPSSKASNAGASSITKMNRQMYTSNPPVKMEVDEKDRDAVLHASALAMAKKMYGQQRTIYDAAKQNETQGRSSRADSSDSDEVRPMQFGNLQEQAYKLAQERLARLHDEHQKHRDYQDYYATPSPPASPRKLTRLGQLRRRSSSDGELMSSPYNDDQKRSRNIQKQMSIFSNRLSEVDGAKRSRDREALLAAAQRNVKATLQGIDEKMYRETGRVAPAKLNDWENKAHTAAQAKSEARKEPDVSGKVNLGAGAYMDQAEVDAVAAREVQPILDDIHERAEAERQRIEAQKEEQERKRTQAAADRERNVHNKEDQRKFKGEYLHSLATVYWGDAILTKYDGNIEEEKSRKEELKHEAKARKEEEKAARAEEKRLAREEQNANDTAFDDADKTTEETAEKRRSRLLPFTHKLQTKDNTPAANNANNDSSPLSPSSTTTTPESAGSSKVKNWLKLRLHKPRANSMSFSNKNGNGAKFENPPGGFVGGHRLTGLHPDGTGSLTSLGEPRRSASMTEVALANTRSTATTAPAAAQDEPGESSFRSQVHTPPLGGGRSPGGGGDGAVSSASSDYGDNVGPAAWEAMRNMDNANKVGLSPPAASEHSNRDSKFIEIIE